MGRNRSSNTMGVTTEYVKRAIKVMKEKNICLTAFDPGSKTGVVGITAGCLLTRSTISENDMICTKSEKLPISGRLWVVENFSVYPWASESLAFTTLAPVRVIGMLQIHAFNVGANIHYQNAAQVKTFISDSMLMAAGWWKSLTNQHEKDAARHALYRIFKLYTDEINIS